jgi:GMP synthase-like glutamine amidotransferase
MPRELVITARTDDGEIMAVSTGTLKIIGVQFHPESILTLTEDRFKKFYGRLRPMIRGATSKLIDKRNLAFEEGGRCNWTIDK